MRFSITKGFAEAERAWRDAYAKFDTFADAGDDGIDCGGTIEATDAGKAEGETLDALTNRPAITTLEIKRKIDIIQTERLSALCVEDLQSEYDQIKLDLINLWRPNASPGIAAAFAEWAKAQRHFYAQRHDDDVELGKRGDAVTETRAGLMGEPCTTPGDFIVKAFVDLITNAGATYKEEGGGPFMPDIPNLDKWDARVWKDIVECDLGRCMIVLGNVEFDAAEYMRIARMAGKDIRVIKSGAEKRGLSFGMTGPHSNLDDWLSYLMAGGLQDISTQRCIAIADEIEANYPALVFDLREAVAA